MKMGNTGWKFYKGIYRNLSQESEHIDESILNEIENTLFDKKKRFFDYVAPYGFKLKVSYPGLLIGIGYIHGLPNDDKDIKVGFYFDYVSGYPVIPGSSVKGVLRNFFEGEFLEDKQQLINEILNKNVDINILKNEIFEGIDKEGNPINIYERDKFLDVFIESAGKIFVFDYITPHKEFTDPVPIKFLKIRPGVEFVFNFELYDGIISAKEKEQLFFELLKIHGIGAKTNSGYGHFEDSNISMHSDDRLRQREEVANQRKKAIEEKRKKEELKKLPPHKRIFEEYKTNLAELINNIENISTKENADIIELAKLIKSELQKNPKTWDNAKKKALKRKEKIQKILKEI
jgi:CRISPR-associated protein Cmr6